MAKTKKDEAAVQAANTNPTQEPEINEVDGEPIFHAPDEEGDDDE